MNNWTITHWKSLFAVIAVTALLPLLSYTTLKAQQVELLLPTLLTTDTQEEPTQESLRNTSIPEEEKQALIDIYNNCDGANWFPSYSRWDLNADPSTWKGVTIKDGHVTSLKIDRKKVSGEIPASIGNLKELEVFHCYSNRITKLPDELFTLPKLKELWAQLQNAGGEKTLKQALPPKIDLPKCEIFSLSDNEFSGSFPSDTNLPKVKMFLVQSNKITGAIPESLAKSPQLQFFYAFDNDFTGEIPQDWSQCTQLKQVVLDNNKQLGGQFPSSWTSLTSLMSIAIQKTSIEGEIPSSIGNLTTLGDFLVTGSKMKGKIPESIGNCSALTKLALADCQFTGPLPESISKLSKLILFQVTNNPIGGEIPIWLSKLPNLLDLRMAKCQFTGKIPAEIFPAEKTSTEGLVMLKNFDLSYNELVGAVPSQVTNCKKLTRIWLCYNKLGGNPTSYFTYENFPELVQIELQDNRFEGDIGDLFLNPERVLTRVNISNNNFSGNILPAPTTSVYGVLLGFQFQGVLIAGNRFTFADFSNLKGSLQEGLEGDKALVYTPQQPISEDVSKEVKEGVGMLLEAQLDDPFDWEKEGERRANKYQWYKDDNPIAEATNPQLKIESFKATDAGTYHCQINNDIAPKLTLKTGLYVLSLATSTEQISQESLSIVRSGNTISIEGVQEIALFDLEGACIAKEYSNTLSVEGLESGYYIVTARLAGQLRSVKYFL